MEQKAAGAYVSPFDYRDQIAAAALPALATPIAGLPATLHTDLGSVVDQNKIPACIAHNVMYIVRRYFFKTTGVWLNLSPRFYDIMAKRYDGADRLTGGTYPRTVLKIAKDFGCATTDMLPNDTTLPVLKYRNDALITDSVLQNAAQYKIPGFINIPNDPISTRNAIYLYEALSSLFIIDDEFWTPSWLPKDIDPVRPPVSPVSGHQLAPVGWSSPTFNIGRNEWSEDWDVFGEFHYDPAAWQPYIREQWAIAEVPKDITAFLRQLPSPHNFNYVWLRNLTRGDFSIDVGMVQVVYMMLGYLSTVTPDEFGHFGPKTMAANYAFQTASGIVPSAANVGPITRAALNKKFS